MNTFGPLISRDKHVSAIRALKLGTNLFIEFITNIAS